jgi:uncharacterized protein (DUF1800 family)
LGADWKVEDVIAGLGQGDYFYYTEDDVQAAAKVFSGFEFDPDLRTTNLSLLTHIDPDTLLPRGKVRGSAMNASAHHNEPKQFSARFGNAIIEPDPLLLNGTQATEESALDEISRFIDLIYEQDETSNHICRKIYRFFMYHEITDTLSDDKYHSGRWRIHVSRTNDFKIQPVIEELLGSQHFYNNNSAPYTDDAFGGIIKSPLDLVLGTISDFLTFRLHP